MLILTLITNLRRCCAELHSLPSSKDIPRKAVLMVAELARVPYVEIWLKDDESNFARLSAVNDEAYLTEDSPRILPLDSSVVGEVITTGAVKIHPDLREVRSWLRGDWSEKRGLTRYIGVPLVCEGRVVGAFSILAEHGRQLGELELQILRLFAEQTAIAYVGKQAQKALWEWEERSRDILENANDLIQSVSPDGRFLYVNDAWRKTLGYTGEEIEGITLFDIIHPSYHEHCVEIFHRVLAGEKISPFEAVFVAKDGEQIHVEGSTSYRFEDGEPVATRGFFRDITKRKRAEKELRVQKDRSEKYLEIAGVIIVVIDHDRKVSLINRKGCEVLGYDEDEIVGKDWFENFLPEGVRDEVGDVFDSLVARNVEPVEYFENPVLTRSSEERIISWQNTVLKDEAGRIIQILSSGEDITERKRAEEALKKSEERYRALMKSASDAIMLADAEGNILEANMKSEKLLGYTRDELLTMHFSQFHPEEELERTIDAFREHFERGYGGLSDGWVLRKDGTRVPVDISASVIEFSGKKISQAIFRDMTERKKAEEALVESLREKSLLLHELNHRVNNNLQLISSLLDMTGSRSESQEAQELVRDCRARIHAMAFIHSELYQSASFEKVNLARISRTLMEHLKRAYLREGTQITLQAQVEGVELPLSQAVPCTLVINELVTNAMKHAFVGRARGTVAFHISELPDDTIRILVQDDGVGMPADWDFSGTSSLGLSLVRNLVEKQLKGAVEFHRGKGTTFCVEFPKGGILDG